MPLRSSIVRSSSKNSSKPLSSLFLTDPTQLTSLFSPLNKPPPKNVLPQVNKGLALYQWKQDIVAAERCCQEALQTDPECEAAVATLAQLSLQQGKTDQAMDMFKRQAELARSEPELINALTYQYATKGQIDFVAAYPDMGTQLGAMARAMM